MSILDEAYWTGRDYPGGTEALAHRLGHRNLSDELNPQRNAKLGLQTALDMQLMSGDFRILYRMAAELRHFPPVPMPDGALGSDSPCLKKLSQTAKEFSELIATIVEVVDDDEVSDNELARVERQRGELLMTLQNLMQQLGAMNASLKSRAPGAAP